MAAIKAKGGLEAFFSWLVQQINEAFAKLFGAIATPPSDPTTDEEAIEAIAFKLAKMKLTMINGVPVLS